MRIKTDFMDLEGTQEEVLEVLKAVHPEMFPQVFNIEKVCFHLETELTLAGTRCVSCKQILWPFNTITTTTDIKINNPAIGCPGIVSIPTTFGCLHEWIFDGPTDTGVSDTFTCIKCGEPMCPTSTFTLGTVFDTRPR